MAFPQVQSADTQSGSVTVDSTSWTLTYPTNLLRGDLVLAVFGTDGIPALSVIPTGWTILVQTPAAASAATGILMVKEADGSESGNFSVTLTVAEQGVWRVLRIKDWYGAGGFFGTDWNISVTNNTPTQLGIATGTSTAPNATSADPYAWATEDTLWMACCMMDDGDTTTTGFPTNYVNGVSQESGGATGAAMGLAFRELNAGSEDAGAFTTDASQEWVAFTMGIRGDNALANYPVVDGIASTGGITATANAAVQLPYVVDAGDLLIVLHRSATSTLGHGYPAGWTELFDDNSDASDDRTSCAWKLADGSEGGTTITVTQDNIKFASIALVTKGAANPNFQPPEFATLVTGTSTTPDPGTVTPTGGAKNYLILWTGGWEGEQTSPPVGSPTNYDGQVGQSSGTAGAVTTNVRVAMANRQVNAASENPGSWTISASDDWTATAIAVHPVRVPRNPAINHQNPAYL